MPDEPELPEAVDLVAFLTARWDETEALAESWPDDISPTATDGRPWRDSSGHYIYAPRAYVLADLASKRAILEMGGSECGDYRSEYATMAHYPDPDFMGFCDGCSAAESCDIDHQRVLRILAQPFRAHPDFDPAWEV